MISFVSILFGGWVGLDGEGGPSFSFLFVDLGGPLAIPGFAGDSGGDGEPEMAGFPFWSRGTSSRAPNRSLLSGWWVGSLASPRLPLFKTASK